MFTGLIETVGTIEKLTARKNYLVIDIASGIKSEELAKGESIACDGACLTVVEISNNSFTVEASQETIAKTIIETYQNGSRINLERAMKLGDRLGGHLVSGHIDTVGSIRSRKSIGESVAFTVAYDKQFDSLIIPKGSIALNGVSLTVNDVMSGACSVNLIPHSQTATTFETLKENSSVNIEFDMIGKYIQKLHATENNGLTLDKLKESGW